MIDAKWRQMRTIVHGIHGGLVHAAAELPPVALAHSNALSLALFDLELINHIDVILAVQLSHPLRANSVGIYGPRVCTNRGVEIQRA